MTTLDDFSKVCCMDCKTDGDLFFDLSSGKERTSGGEEVEYVNIDAIRDPVRCILCRKNPRCSHNDLLECEDCQEHYGPFYWTGTHKDIILCKDCLEEELQ